MVASPPSTDVYDRFGDSLTMDSKLSLKAALIPITTLNFSGLSLDDIRAQLQKKQSEAPALFNNLPCVLDLAGMAADAIPLDQLHGVCVENGLQPIAVRNAGETWAAQIATLQLADLGTRNPRRGEGSSRDEGSPHGEDSLHGEGSASEAGQDEKNGSASTPAEDAASTGLPAPDVFPPRAIRVHKGNIRSGQQFHFDGDLVIQGTVNPGAEVLATGDIHVYGAMRGKVLAGIKGDESAVIGCQQFDPELVAIAGHYRLFEEEHPEHNQSVVIRLVDDTLNITSN